MNFLKGLGLFLLGAGVSGVITWKLTKDKYTEPLEVFEYQPKEEDGTEDRAVKGASLKPSLMDYYKNRQKKIVEEEHYILEEKNPSEENSENLTEVFHEDEKTFSKIPYPIYANEFGEFDDYQQVTLYLFSDNILTNDDYDMLSKSDVADMVGEDFQMSIGMDEDDSGHIRNDVKKTDYEVLIDSRKYHDALRELG